MNQTSDTTIKSSKSFSKEHTWLISMCDDKGNAVCAFCQARF